MDYDNNQGYGYEPETEKKGFRFWFLIGAGAIFMIALITAAAILISTGVKEQKYNTCIAAGNQYFSAGDYQNAIVEYQNALAVDGTKSSAYLNMSSAYIQLGDYISAFNILNQGLSVVGSGDIQTRLAEVETLSNTEFKDAEAQNLSAEEIDEISESVEAENTTFDMIAAYTYTDYFRDYGGATSASQDLKGVTYYYQDAGFYASYYDLENEKVMDTTGVKPIATAKPCYVRVSDLSKIFGTDSEIFAVSKEKITEIFGEETNFYQDEETGKYYVEAEYKHCKIKIETNSDGNIVSRSAWNQIEPVYRSAVEDDENQADGEVSGYVQDALTGNGMKATLKVRNFGSQTGAVLEELQSAMDGSYVYDGAQGKYTIEVSASGYITEYMDVEIIKGQVKTGKNVVLSPAVGAGEIRIVLTWGSTPTDLDSHTVGTSASGGSFHIDFTNRNVNGVGVLDVDDTNGMGPETTTITDVGSSFTFSVVDFTRSGTMNASGAMVKVYLPGSTEAITYTVPAGSGNTWEVFSYSNGNVTPINTLN